MHSQNNTLHRAAVITPHEIAYGNGTARQALPGLARDLRAILAGTLDRFTQHSTIVLDGVTVKDLVAQSEALKADGWKHSVIDAWTLYHRDDGRTVAVGLRDAMGTPHFGVLFGKDTDPGVLAVLLDRYHQATGNNWRGAPVTSALNGIRLSWGNPQYQPLWRHPKTGLRSDMGPLIKWQRNLNEYERTWGYVHTFDANSAYLGSAITAELAWSQLHHSGPQTFDYTLPGYWLLELDTATLASLADPSSPPLFRRTRDGRAWLTTPAVRLLADLGDRCEVADSWTGRAEQRGNGKRLHPAQTRILRTWGESVRDALAATPHDSVEGAVKRTYKDAVGGMQREGMRIYRPDWADTIIDLWRSTMFRTLLRVKETEGVWPVHIATDSVSYADSSPDPANLAKAIGVRPGLGGYKHEATVTTEAFLAAHKPKVRR